MVLELDADDAVSVSVSCIFVSDSMASSLRLSSGSRFATKLSPSLELDPNFLCKLDFKDDFLLPSLDELDDEELFLLDEFDPL